MLSVENLFDKEKMAHIAKERRRKSIVRGAKKLLFP
jgi:hypothetical protein